MIEMSNESKKYPAAAMPMMKINGLVGGALSMAWPMISGLIAAVLATIPAGLSIEGGLIMTASPPAANWPSAAMLHSARIMLVMFAKCQSAADAAPPTHDTRRQPVTSHCDVR